MCVCLCVYTCPNLFPGNVIIFIDVYKCQLIRNISRITIHKVIA